MQGISYWIENQRNFYRQFFRDKHTPRTSELKSALENIGFVCIIEKGSAGRGPLGKEKKTYD